MVARYITPPSTLLLAALLFILLLLPTGEGIRASALEGKSSILSHIDRELLEALDLGDVWAARNEDEEPWRLRRSKSSAVDVDEKIDDGAEQEEEQERHPADEMLQSHRADGSKSYILGGY